MASSALPLAKRILASKKRPIRSLLFFSRIVLNPGLCFLRLPAIKIM